MCSRVSIGVGVRGQDRGTFIEVIPNDPIPDATATTYVLGQPPPQIALIIQRVSPLARFRPTEDIHPLTHWAASRLPIQKHHPSNEDDNDDQQNYVRPH